jgi:hypothetical protein
MPLNNGSSEKHVKLRIGSGQKLRKVRPVRESEMEISDEQGMDFDERKIRPLASPHTLQKAIRAAKPREGLWGSSLVI